MTSDSDAENRQISHEQQQNTIQTWINNSSHEEEITPNLPTSNDEKTDSKNGDGEKKEHQEVLDDTKSK